MGARFRFRGRAPGGRVDRRASCANWATSRAWRPSRPTGATGGRSGSSAPRPRSPGWWAGGCWASWSAPWRRSGSGTSSGSGGEWTRRLLPKRSTWNVHAVAGDPDAERVIAVIAHHDAAHTGAIFDFTLVRWYGRTFPQLLEKGRKWPGLMWLVFARAGARRARLAARAAAPAGRRRGDGPRQRARLRRHRPQPGGPGRERQPVRGRGDARGRAGAARRAGRGRPGDARLDGVGGVLRGGHGRLRPHARARAAEGRHAPHRARHGRVAPSHPARGRGDARHAPRTTPR